MTKTTRARYTLEFKQEAVRLVEGAWRDSQHENRPRFGGICGSAGALTPPVPEVVIRARRLSSVGHQSKHLKNEGEPRRPTAISMVGKWVGRKAKRAARARNCLVCGGGEGIRTLDGVLSPILP